MDYLKITPDRLSVEEISNLVSAPECGAISLFCGTTRDNFDGKEVILLEYEAYDSMALKIMQEICSDARTKWPAIKNIAIYHRLGAVPIQQCSVVIAVSAPHRAESIEATQFCIDNLKSKVPIWKKEKYAGEIPSEWKENKECPWKIRNENNENNKVTPVIPMVDVDLVQVKASHSELMQRIERFMSQKRELLNMTNVLDFCVPNPQNVSDNGEINSCARVDAVLIPRKDSKSHFRVRRVQNLQGPQINHSDFSKNNTALSPVEERLDNAEQHLLLNERVPSDVYERIKQIENRILQLESISPEYCQFWKNIPARSLPPIQTVLSQLEPVQKRKCTVTDIQTRIETLQRELSDK